MTIYIKLTDGDSKKIGCGIMNNRRRNMTTLLQDGSDQKNTYKKAQIYYINDNEILTNLKKDQRKECNKRYTRFCKLIEPKFGGIK